MLCDYCSFIGIDILLFHQSVIIVRSDQLSTSTTIYDVLIAFLGGLAGIIAISSKNKGNIIAGAAIATALMPTLCTACFGLANGNLNFFLSAMYHFIINVVFIGISSVLVCRFLQFPISGEFEGSQKRKIHQLLTFVSLVTIVPSIYFGYALVQRERFTANANKLVADINVFEGSYLLKNNINARTKKITLVYGGSKLSDKSKKEILHLANFASLGNAKIEFQQGFALNENKENISQADKLKLEVNRLSVVLAERQKKSEHFIQLHHRQ